MPSHSAYGLHIQSELPLPELVAGEEGIKVTIRFGKVEQRPLVIDGTGAGFWATAEEACHFLEGVGAFLVRGGREIIVDPESEVEERVLRLSVLGPALGLVLHQQGRFVLHASAIETANGAIAFLGGSGWGKSALAATLHARGYSIVSDDLMALDVSTGGPTVFPGFPQFKLWPEAVIALGEEPERLPQLHPLLEKRAYRVTSFAQHSQLLKRIYVLADDLVSAIEPLRPQGAFVEFVRHWYGARFGDQLLRAGSFTSHFSQCAQLANTVTVRRVKRDRSSMQLLDVALMVEADLALNKELM
jgi:hypothetical protein